MPASAAAAFDEAAAELAAKVPAWTWDDFVFVREVFGGQDAKVVIQLGGDLVSDGGGGFVVLAEPYLRCRDCGKVLEQRETVWILQVGGKLLVSCGHCGDDQGLDRELGSGWQEVAVEYGRDARRRSPIGGGT